MGGGLKRGNWSTHELERLRSLYPRSGAEHVARLLRRSVDSVRRKARDIFATPAMRRPWTGEDDLRLREAYGVLGMAELCLVLARPASQISARIAGFARDLRDGRPWTRGEIAQLKKLYGRRRDEDLVVCLSRSQEQIAAKADELRLSKDKSFLHRSGEAAGELSARPRMPRWQDEEVELLKDSYARQSNLEIARRLGRSVASVANKANQLGLAKDPDVLAALGRRNVQSRYRRS